MQVDFSLDQLGERENGSPRAITLRYLAGPGQLHAPFRALGCLASEMPPRNA
jgi:hypothetical protein